MINPKERVDGVHDGTLPCRRSARIYNSRVGNTFIHPSLSAPTPAPVEPGPDLPIEDPRVDRLFDALHQLRQLLQNGLQPQQVAPEPGFVDAILGVVQVHVSMDDLDGFDAPQLYRRRGFVKVHLVFRPREGVLKMDVVHRQRSTGIFRPGVPEDGIGEGEDWGDSQQP